jgi:hypothetical protein
MPSSLRHEATAIRPEAARSTRPGKTQAQSQHRGNLSSKAASSALRKINFKNLSYFSAREK